MESKKVPIQEILDVAKWYPSGDNCQPFRFRWQNETLTILHDDIVASHEINFSNRSSFIALGMLLTNLKYAARAHSFDINVIETSSSSPSASICFVKTDFVDNKMASLIRQRHVHRGSFTKGDPKIIDTIINSSPSFAGSNIDFVIPKKDEIKKIAYLESLITKWQVAFLQVIAFVHFGKPDHALTGLHWRNLGVNYIDSFFLKLIQKFSWLYFLFVPGIRLNYYFDTIKKLSACNGIISVQAPSFSTESLIGLGQTTMEFWLRITEFGFKMQPLTLSSILVSEIKASNQSPRVPLILTEAVPKNSSEHRFFQKKVGTAYWSFRIGLADDLPAEALTRRLPNSTILED